MAKRGDGIGLEISRDLVRGVRLASGEVGRVAAVCDVPISRFDDNAELFDALVRARGRLGDADAPHPRCLVPRRHHHAAHRRNGALGA
jgi:hypothetical protein